MSKFLSLVPNLTLINFSSLLIYILPITILSGPFIPDLSIVIVSIIFLYLTIKKKEWKYYRNNFFIFFIIFCSYLIITSLLSEFKYISLEASLFYFRFTLFSLAIWFLIDNNKNFIKIFTQFLLATFIFILLDGYIQFFFEYSIFNLAPTFNNRLTLTLTDKLILGGYISRLFPLLLALLIYNYSLRKNTIIYSLLLLILTDVLVYLSGERTAIGILFISTLYIIFLISKFRILRSISLIISLIIIVFITVFSSEVKNRNIDKTLDQMNFNSPQYDILMFSPEHDSMYRTSFNMFLKNPIKGIGPKNFRNLCNDNKYKINDRGCSTHPHNTYLQILAETGTIGFIFLLVLLIYIFRETVGHMFSFFSGKKRRLSDYQVCLMACFVCTLFPFLPTQNIFNNWISIIYFLPVGFYLQSISSIKNQ